MKNKNLFQKIVLIALAVAVLLGLIAPAIFSQTPPAPKQEKLLNGLKVLMWPDAKSDKAYLRVRIHAGSAFDPQGKEGVMQLLADNIFPNDVSREFFSDDLGGSLEIVTNYDFIQINASSRPADFLTMLETVANAVSSPSIDKETTIKLRNALIARLGVLETDPTYAADQAVAKRLFGTFPYGRPQLGSAATLQKIDFADLIDAKGRFLTADNATIAVSGNFDRTLGFRAIRRYFGGWLKSDKRVPATFRQPDEPDVKPLGVDVATAKEPIIRLAIRGLARNDKDFAAAEIVARVAGYRLLSTTPRSAVVDLSVRNLAHTLPGSMVFGYSASPEWVAQNLPAVALTATAPATPDTFKMFLVHLFDKINETEFSKAKAEIQAALATRNPADNWLDEETYKLTSVAADLQSFNTVSQADVQRVADRLSRNPVVFVVASKMPASPK